MSQRSSDRIRAKAVARGERLIETAMEMIREVGTDFTVQELVERSNTSLRSFYQYFGGKDGLLLAILEEALALGLARQLEATAAAGSDPVARVRAFLLSESEQVDETDVALSRALVVYHQRLAEDHPETLIRAMHPIYLVLVDLVSACRKAGRIRADTDDRASASILLQTLVASLHARVLGVHYGGHPVTADETWAMISDGILTANT